MNLHKCPNVVLALGLISFCVPLLGTVAWVAGHRAVKEMDCQGITGPDRRAANTGRILGIAALVVTSLLALSVIGGSSGA